MPKVSEDVLTARREEIIDACAHLYETMPFRQITIKEIGKVTSFNRTTIYNYFNTKEEIFLALMQRDYERWTEELTELADGAASLSREELADALACSVARQARLLKLLSMNHYDMEENSRLENLVGFKRAYGDTMKAVRRLLDRFCEEMDEKEKTGFLYAFFPFLFGVYPYTAVTEYQRMAMEEAGVGFQEFRAYELTNYLLYKMLGCKTNAHGESRNDITSETAGGRGIR